MFKYELKIRKKAGGIPDYEFHQENKDHLHTRSGDGSWRQPEKNWHWPVWMSRE